MHDSPLHVAIELEEERRAQGCIDIEHRFVNKKGDDEQGLSSHMRQGGHWETKFAHAEQRA